jgi:hypothetical protein
MKSLFRQIWRIRRLSAFLAECATCRIIPSSAACSISFSLSKIQAGTTIAIIFCTIGFTSMIDYGGMHESAGDLVAILSVLHFTRLSIGAREHERKPYEGKEDQFKEAVLTAPGHRKFLKNSET